jgi:hypothetical protein
MLFNQVKSLAYLIFANIVICQISPGIYIIENRQVNSDVLAVSSPNPNDIHVIGRPLAQGSVQLARWIIEGSPGFYTIRNAQTNNFLTNNGGKVIVTPRPFGWHIDRRSENLLSIVSTDTQLYLSIEAGPAPNSISVARFDEPYSLWTLIPSS